MVVDTRWFQNKLHDKHISQRSLARMLELDPAAVSLMLRGRRKMTAKEAAEIARLLGVGVDEVLTRSGAGAPRQTRSAGAGAIVSGFETTGAKGREKSFEGDMVELPVPMVGGGTARLTVPRGLTKADAERIAAMLSAFAVK